MRGHAVWVVALAWGLVAPAAAAAQQGGAPDAGPQHRVPPPRAIWPVDPWPWAAWWGGGAWLPVPPGWWVGPFRSFDRADGRFAPRRQAPDVDAVAQPVPRYGTGPVPVHGGWYCPSSGAYYPNVLACAQPWMRAGEPAGDEVTALPPR